VLSLAGAAQAADPIMPLSEVQPGMVCTARSVTHGTAISSFDAEVLDVIADDPAAGGARLLVRVSGPAIDATGVGPGFSGSPILCDGRYAGAISEGIGDYGNKVLLATPIEAILGARPTAAASARRAPALLRAARPLTAPLTVSGLSSRTRRLLSRAAAKVDRTVLAAPPGPLAGYPVQDPVPGAAVAASLSTGDISVGAVGTVAYRDGDQVFSRVLAGTMPRGGAAEDRARVAELVGSAKDQEEHRYAVESLVRALEPHVTGLQAPAEPGVLELSNVSHLVTDVTARLDDSSHVLDLLAALHPTAAVGGTPREAALRTIAELEGMHRGRYAGATGWVDAAGDGEWGLALRCAQVSGRSARLFAGCGIVGASDPDTEVLEAQAKFVPVRDALEGS